MYDRVRVQVETLKFNVQHSDIHGVTRSFTSSSDSYIQIYVALASESAKMQLVRDRIHTIKCDNPPFDRL